MLTFFYLASSLCITVLLAGFLAILVEPILTLLEKSHVPRAASVALVVVLGMILVSATLLAVPLTAIVKLVPDSHPALLPISNLLGDTTPNAALGAGGPITVARTIPFFRDRFRV